MTETAFGIALPLDAPLEELLEVARRAEELGYDFLWANDDRLQRDVFAVLAAMALETRRIRLGPGVTNPYSRHPALTAAAVATLDELSGGRAVLGLGAGGTNHRALAVERRAPVSALREAVDVIRGLLAGREVTLDGRVIRTCEATLDFVPVRDTVPIYIGARGPKVLELAGEIADGVIVGNVATLEGWRYATARIAAGAARSGRDPNEIDLTAWVYACVADDGRAALDAIRPMVATSLATSREVLHELGIDLPSAYAELMEHQGWNLSREAVARAGALVPEETLRRFAIAGSAAECREQVGELLDAFPLISQVAIVPATVPGQPVTEVAARFMAEVAPHSSSNVAGRGF